MIKRFFVFLLLLPALAFAETFVAGKDYEVINNAEPDTSEKGIVVTEFFSYGCPWCFKLEPTLDAWVKKHQSSSVRFNQVPVVFHPEWSYYAKAFYAANLLGISDKMNPLLFKAIQTDKKNLSSEQAMIDFFVANGVDKDTAESAFTHSTTINMKVGEGNALMASYHVNAVPAIVIGGRYKTDLQMAQGEERFFKIMDYLISLDKRK
ncbi:thiol:disulfide interchange protein DsbA/DsbL [Legionella sp. CNM-4043-24]|uniref:thiol:disulfide interchange protein DsbA/DsbL n=1 Tax=Legionella sp. CNM-4043-24 TaxID=3421646 RepID=UPI00403B0F15